MRIKDEKDALVNILCDLVNKVMKEEGEHIATHKGAGYFYLENNDFDYTQVSSYPVSTHEAILWAMENRKLKVTTREIIIPGIVFDLGEGSPSLNNMKKNKRGCKNERI